MPTRQLRRIILVEDDPLDRMLTRRILEEMDIPAELITFSDGREFLDFVAEGGTIENASVILLDLKMPRVNGLEVLEQLHAQGRSARVPIVVMSSSSVKRDVDRAYELGARAFLTKPITHEEFREAVLGVGLFWCKYNLHPELA